MSSRLRLALLTSLVTFLVSCSTKQPVDGGSDLSTAFGDSRGWIADIAEGEAVEVGNVDGLISVLRAGNGPARARAARALGKLRAAPAVQILGQTLNDSERWAVQEAIVALQKIGTPEAVHLLEQDRERSIGPILERLRAATSAERNEAVRALYDIGPKALYGIPDLRAAVNDPDVLVRTNAELTLLKLGVRQSEIEDSKVVPPSREAFPTAQSAHRAPGLLTLPDTLVNLDRAHAVRTAPSVFIESIKSDPHKFTGKVVAFDRIRFEGDVRRIGTLPGTTRAGAIYFVSIRDERGSVLVSNPEHSKILVELPAHLRNQTWSRIRRGGHFAAKARIGSVGDSFVVSIIDLTPVE